MLPSNINEQVLDARIPNLSSFFPRENPLLSFGTINADIPLCFKFLSVVAKTTAVLAS